MERDFKELKLTKEEIRLIGLAIADTIIDNNAKLKATTVSSRSFQEKFWQIIGEKIQ